jgi:hypothetical protein
MKMNKSVQMELTRAEAHLLEAIRHCKLDASTVATAISALHAQWAMSDRKEGYHNLADENYELSDWWWKRHKELRELEGNP